MFRELWKCQDLSIRRGMWRFAQCAAEEIYRVAQAQLTRVPWTAIDLEKLWCAEHRTIAPWFAEAG